MKRLSALLLALVTLFTVLSFSGCGLFKKNDDDSSKSYRVLKTCTELDTNLSGVLQKIGFSTDPYNNFVSDADTPGVMTLHNDGNIRLTLTNFPLKPNILANHPSNFSLDYTEKYEVPLTDGRITNVTRGISMFFSGSEDTLSFISMQVQMQYPLNQD